MQKNALILFALLALLGCKSKQLVVEAVENPRPAWVQGKPISSLYYSGIGVARKIDGTDFIATAKNNALNDLASEISVTVSSNSFFYQVENDANLRAEFQMNTKLKSKESLEGFELMDTYESATEYWVYYRLDKASHQQLKQNRLNNAVALSKQYFKKAIDFRQNGQIVESINFNIKAIDALKAYMADPVKTDWEGEEIFLLPYIYSHLQQTLSSIRLEPKLPMISAKRGETISTELTAFSARDEKGLGIARLPVFIFYSGERMANNQLVTNNAGIANIALPRITSNNAIEYLQVNVNMVAIVSEATDDVFLRKFLSKLTAPESRLEIHIERPRISVQSTEFNLGQPLPSKLIATAFTQRLIEDGFAVVNGNQTAEYTLYVSAQTREGAKQNQFYTALLDANFRLVDAQNNILYEQSIQGFVGMQLSTQAAGEDAYKKLAQDISRRYYRDMRRKAFD